MKLLLAVLCASCLLPISCLNVATWQEQARPWTRELLEDAEEVRVTDSKGLTIELEDVELQGETLQGRRTGAKSSELVTFDLADLETLEVRKLEARRVFGNIGLGALYAVATVSLLILLFAASLG